MQEVKYRYIVRMILGEQHEKENQEFFYNFRDYVFIFHAFIGAVICSSLENGWSRQCFICWGCCDLHTDKSIRRHFGWKGDGAAEIFLGRSNWRMLLFCFAGGGDFPG